jgi:hypothetical protein
MQLAGPKRPAADGQRRDVHQEADMTEMAEVNIFEDSHGEWQPWCETVGFVLRRITRRSFSGGANLMVEFDILNGCVGQYVTTGLWAIDSRLPPVGDPVCTPIGFSEALSMERICTHLSLPEASERLLSAVRESLRGRA